MNENIYDKVKQHFREFYKEIFPKNTGQFERHFKDTIELETSRGLFESVRRNAGITQNSKILDVGCGFGTFVLVGRIEGYRVYGVDAGEYEIKFARKRLLTKIHSLSNSVYQAASAECLPFKDESFDVITLWNLLEHVPDYKMVLNEINRVLKKGGYIFLVSPNYLMIREEPHYHLLWFSLMPREVAKLYLKLRGRNPDFFLNNIFYLTNMGVSKCLKAMGYELGVDIVLKFDKPSLCNSKFKAKILKIAKRLKLKSIVEIAIFVNYFNPLKRSVYVCAKKG